MKLTSSITAAIAATLLSSLSTAEPIHHIQARGSCSLDTKALCPSCDGKNLTTPDGDKWVISCNWVADADGKEAVAGKTSTKICLDACEDDDDCFSVNLASNGSCVILTGSQKGLKSSPGLTNIARIAAATTSTSKVRITTTFTQFVSTGTGTAASAPAASTTNTPLIGSCDVANDKVDLCPPCNGKVAIVEGASYRVLCNTTLNSTGSYSPQEWLSPEGCLQECNDHPEFCTGASFFEGRSCQLAKMNPIAEHDESHTAFLPISTVSSMAISRASSTASKSINTTITTRQPTASASIPPINPGCDFDNVTCPACDGAAITDALGGSYTALCNYEPVCMSNSTHRDPSDQATCLGSCDQDVLCLAARWFPSSGACQLCREGIVEDNMTGANLSFVFLLADNDGDGEDGDGTLSPSWGPTSSRNSSTTTSRTSGSITAFPSPFPKDTTAFTSRSVGTITIATIPSDASTSIRTTAASSFTYDPTSTSISKPSNTTDVACPAFNGNVYSDSNENYFVVGCDSRFDADSSQYISAPNFEACAAACTGRCGGIQYGYTTRCGLYTDISVVARATGWTVAASITFPIKSTGFPASITTAGSTVTHGARTMATTSTPVHVNGTVTTKPSISRAPPAAYT